MGKKDDEQSVSSEGKGPLKTFQSLMGEGERFSHATQYVKAVQSFTEALDLLPIDEDKSSEKDINDRLSALVARSACYLKLGKNDLALQDAEESLKSNKEYPKGLLQKAEALYSMGEFELALMFFHRGKKIRPDLREFQSGINKAQEAIDNSVGDPNRVKLEATGDLSIFYKNDEDEAKKRKKAPMGYVRASQKREAAIQRKQHKPMNNPRTTKQLLGDLYEDRVFLDKIINNTSVTKTNTRSGDAIYQLASDGIDYLDSRTDFWRQQQPMYARTKAVKKPEGDDDIFKHIRRELEAIDNLQNMDQFLDARRRAQHLVDFCDRLDERKFSEKLPALADAYSRLGNAYLEMGDYQKALEYHDRDLRIGEMKQYNERISRALDNLGRVYARSGQFPQAIQVWERKIPLANSPLEKAWLFHEIGQCQFGLGDYEKSKKHGERSLAEAIEANDPVWQLNAKVLIAHSQTKLRQYRDAEQTFAEALALAREQNDVAAERAIERAIRDVRDQIDKGAADSPPDRPETNYDIRIKSSDMIIYADDSRQSLVHLTIFGDNGSSGAIELANGENDTKKFDPRSINLKKKAFDAGKLTKLALTYDNVDSWPLDHIEVTDPKRKNKIRFCLPQPFVSMADTVDLYPEPCIVSSSHSAPGKKDDKKPKPAVKPQKKPIDGDTHRSKPGTERKVEYTVTIQTGSNLSSGTDANVFISLNGDKQKLARRQLEKSDSNKDAFERGKKDVFKFTETDIGRLKTIILEHDDSGMASGWFVDHVEVNFNNETYKFPIDRWLDKDEADHSIKLELEPNKKPSQESPANQPASDPNKNTPYVITVTTANVSSAGTDANVSITLHGDKGDTGPHALKKPEGGNDPFEKGSKDVFKFNEINIGKLKTITIGHDDSGMASGWLLESVEVKVNNDTYTFPVGRWLDKKEDDGKTSLDLEPNKKPASKKPTETPKPTASETPRSVPQETSKSPAAETPRSVPQETSKSPAAETPRSVPSDKNKSPAAETPRSVPSDKNKSPAAETPRSVPQEGSKPPASEIPASIPYTVTVQTGDVSGAGTDANVYLSLHGDKTKVEKQRLKEPQSKKDPFEKGGKDVFVFNANDVGKLKTINIQHDGSGFGDGWYLESIEVKFNDNTYNFPVGRWLDSNEDDGKISLDLEPNKKPASKKSEEPKSTMNIPPNNTPYTVSVQTGNIAAGGTDAKVMISIYGDKSKIIKHVLSKTESGKNPFEIGNTDVFKFSDVDVGKVKTITIEHDNGGMASGWYLESVEVNVNNVTTKFPVGRWLDVKEDDGRISLDLEPNKKPGSRLDSGDTTEVGAVEYEVVVRTADKRGAGTDANVYLSLYGDKGKAERRQLKQSSDGKMNLFEQGATDRFQIYEKDVGKIKTIRIEHDGTGIGSGWYVDSIEIRAVTQNQAYKFPVDRWLDTGEGDKKISIELHPDQKPGQGDA